MIFEDRIEAGRILGRLLASYENKEVVVYALPRGGVIVGAEVAKALHAPLDLIITIKITDPLYPEIALGAVAKDHHSVLSDEVLKIDPLWIAEETERAIEKALTRHIIYQKNQERISCRGKVAILVDDGIATGLSVRAAIQELKLHEHPKKIIVAVPVSPRKILNDIATNDVEVLSVITVKNFKSVSKYYRSFPQISDQSVIKILRAEHKLINHKHQDSKSIGVNTF